MIRNILVIILHPSWYERTALLELLLKSIFYVIEVDEAHIQPDLDPTGGRCLNGHMAVTLDKAILERGGMI